MTQLLINTLNNMQEMINSSSRNTFAEKQTVKNNSLPSSNDKDFSMDKSSLKEPTNFDKVFNKQMETQAPSTLGDLKAIKNNEVEIDTKNDIKSQDVETLIDYKNSLTDSLVKLQEFISQVTNEANTENSLDLTLARDINEIINQLKEITEETAESIESSTEDSCTAVIENLISNITDSSDEESTETIMPEENPSNEEISVEDLKNAYEKLLAYTGINKQEFENISSNENEMDLMDELNQQSSEIEIEFNNDIIDYASKTLTNENIKTTEKTQTSEIEVPIYEDSLKELNIESIKAETNTSENNSSLMEQQSPEEIGVKAMLNQDLESFELKLEKTTETVNTQQPQAKPTEVTQNKIIEQISKQLEGLQNNSKVNIVLNPESLGKVTIQLIKTGEGLSAQFTVASQEVKDMLMKGLDGLKESLLTQGVGVENVSIKLNDTQKSEYNSDWTEQEGSRGGNKEQGRSNKEEKEKGLFEQMMAQTDNENGNV